MPENRENTDQKVTIRIPSEHITKLDSFIKLANCKSRNELIEKAIEFYIGYITAESNTNYLSDVITTTIDGIISGTEKRLSRLQFKEAVELAKLSKLISMMLNYDEDIIKQIHIDAVNEVKKINGFIDYRPFKG